MVATAPPPAWHPPVRVARAYASHRPGTIAFSVRTPCGEWGVRQDAVMPGASLLKPVLLVAYLRHAHGRDLRRGERRLLGPMIRRSDDAAAGAVIARLGEARIERVARRAGMRHFALRDPWGLSSVTAREQTRLWLTIDRRVPRRHRAYERRLLRTIVAGQRWGLARARPAGWTLHFKGGWGSGTGWVDHQSALLTRGDQRIAVSVLQRSTGTHAAGKRTLRGLGRRLARGLRRERRIC